MSTRPFLPSCWRCGLRRPAWPPTQCDHCGQQHFDNPRPCGEAVVIRNGRVLMVQRAHDPWRGYWDLPGGFCEPDESPAAASERELAEEVGIGATAAIQLGAWTDTYGHDVPGGAAIHTLNIAYLMEHTDDEGLERAASDEITGIAWFPLGQLPANLAFPDHLAAVLSRACELASGRAAEETH